MLTCVACGQRCWCWPLQEKVAGARSWSHWAMMAGIQKLKAKKASWHLFEADMGCCHRHARRRGGAAGWADGAKGGEVGVTGVGAVGAATVVDAAEPAAVAAVPAAAFA